MLAQRVVCPTCKAVLDLKSAPRGTTIAKCAKCGGLISLAAEAEQTEATSAHDTPILAVVDTAASATTFPPDAQALLEGLKMPVNPSSSDDGTLAAPTGAPPSGEFSFLAPASQPDELGRLGPYRVLGVLGAGGMGAVFRAEDPTLRRQIALKVMLPQFASNAMAKARFLREARSQAAVEHDHIIAIYQVGEEGAVPFIAMPLLKGQTLADALKANPNVPISEAIRIAREMASGLAAAHEMGLVHRDIKPANVWLEGKSRRVKILDFGLARAETEGEATEQVTQQGMIVGTPGYMSPEQAQGESVDARTDLFSLGIVLYQMLTSRQPFNGKSTPAILMAVVSHTPQRPAELNPQVPAELDALTMQLLAKAPAHRPATAEALVEAFRAIEAAMNRTAQIPVYYAPPAALAAPDPWEGIANTDVASGSGSPPSTSQAVALPEPEGESRPASRASDGTGSSGSKGPPWMLIGSLLAFVVVVVVAAVALMNKPKDNDISKAPDETKPGKENPKGNPPKKDIPATDPDRKAAEWVLSIGGSVKVNGEDRDIKAAADLPKDRFTLTGVELQQNKAVTDAGLAHFKDCKNLTYLSLWYDRQVTDAGLAHFKDCKSLATIKLALTQVTDAGLAHFKDCKSLTFLDVYATGVTDAGLAHFKDCKSLTHLWLAGTQTTDVGLAHFKDCKSLTHLNLQEKSITDAWLADFKQWKALAYLNLHSTPVGDVGLAHLKECTTLRELQLTQTKVTAKGVEEFAKVLPQCRIEWDGGIIEPIDVDRKAAEFALSLGFPVSVRLEDGNLPHITAVADLPKAPFQVNGIILKGDRVTDAALANFKDCKNLQTLNLAGTMIGDVGLAHLTGCKNLTYLVLSGTHVTDAGLSVVKNFEKLTTVTLDNTKITDAGFEFLKERKTLTSVGLQTTKVTAKGVEEFAKALPGCKIEWDGGVIEPKVIDDRKATESVFALGGFVWINDQGKDIKAVADLPNAPFAVTHVNLNGTQTSDGDLTPLQGCRLLVSLALDNTRITDVGLAGLKDCKKLTHLWLSGTQVTDAGLTHLKQCKQLTRVVLQKTKVTAKGVEQFHAAVPGCKIEFDGGIIEPIDVDRKAAEWVISQGGFVNVTPGNKDIRAVTELPKDPFRVRGVNLEGTQVTDAGLAQLSGLKGLTGLMLAHTRVADAGLVHLKGCKGLAGLNVSGTQVTDAGLVHLNELHGMKELILSGSKVTAEGVKKLASALPGCQIHWDGGIIEPKK